MKNLILIFIGGGFGSVLRYFLSENIRKTAVFQGFPLGTFCVNLTGCLLIGFLSGLLLKENQQWKFLLITGFCGGFTTFSTFSSESLTLIQDGKFLQVGLYIVFSVLLGIFGVFAGLQVSKLF